MPLAIPQLTDDEADDMLAEAFPNGLPAAKGRGGVASAIQDAYPLGEEHLQALVTHATTPGAKLGVAPQPLNAVRHTHHKLARLLALGMDESRAAYICNYDVSRVSILKSDPLFIEVLNYYSIQVEESFVDTVEVMKGLSLDALGELTSRLQSNPNSFTVPHLIELVKAMADRSGNGPTSNHNVNARVLNLTADDIQRIKNNDQRSPLRQVRDLTEEDRVAFAERLTHHAATGDTEATAVEEGSAVGAGVERAPTGDELREEDCGDTPAVDAGPALPSVVSF